MPNEPIDKKCSVQLPNSDRNVFVQLQENRPEGVEYQIDLKSPQGKVINVVPRGRRQLPVLHDLGRSANALRGYTLACVGAVSFKVGAKWKLKLETAVNNTVVNTCGPGEIDATQGGMSTFRFICDFK